MTNHAIEKIDNLAHKAPLESMLHTKQDFYNFVTSANAVIGKAIKAYAKKFDMTIVDAIDEFEENTSLTVKSLENSITDLTKGEELIKYNKKQAELAQQKIDNKKKAIRDNKMIADDKKEAELATLKETEETFHNRESTISEKIDTMTDHALHALDSTTEPKKPKTKKEGNDNHKRDKKRYGEKLEKNEEALATNLAVVANTPSTALTASNLNRTKKLIKRYPQLKKWATEGAILALSDSPAIIAQVALTNPTLEEIEEAGQQWWIDRTARMQETQDSGRADNRSHQATEADNKERHAKITEEYHKGTLTKAQQTRISRKSRPVEEEELTFTARDVITANTAKHLIEQIKTFGLTDDDLKVIARIILK